MLLKMGMLYLFALICSPAGADIVAPRYTVDLDTRPEERWSPMMLQVIDTHGWEYSFEPVMKFVENILPYEEWVKYDKILQSVSRPIVGDTIVRELTGIHATAVSLGKNVTMSELLFFQLFYELMMQCTGILSKNADGTVIHGRNMDIGLPVGNLTSQVTWMRNGKPLFTSTQYLGYQGVHTGMRHNNGHAGEGWSVQVNERVVLIPGPIIGYQEAILLNTVARFVGGGAPVGSAIRSALSSANNFSSSIPILSSVKLASPMYIIVGGGGKGEGMVVVRDPDGLAQTSQCGKDVVIGCPKPKSTSDTQQDLMSHPNAGEHLVNTNWDNWVATTSADCEQKIANFTKAEEKLCEGYIRMVYGDKNSCSDLCQLYSDGRREVAKKTMAALQPHQVNPSSVLRALSVPPVLNGGTVFSSVMSAQSDYYHTVVRGIRPPCGECPGVSRGICVSDTDGTCSAPLPGNAGCSSGTTPCASAPPLKAVPVDASTSSSSSSSHVYTKNNAQLVPMLRKFLQAFVPSIPLTFE